MALFPSEDVLPAEESARRRAVTQEAGTRRLVIGFVALMVAWFLLARLWDIFLLRQAWHPLAPDPGGLTVVGTLDKRGDYDRNLFRIVHVEGDARAELTNYGWSAIFTGQHGALTSERVGKAIRSAIDLDSETGYAMLAPFLAAEVRSELGDPHAYDAIKEGYPIETQLPLTDLERTQKQVPRRSKTLRELIDHFEQESPGQAPESHEAEGQSGSEHSVEHGLTIPPEVLTAACPTVVVSRHFSGGHVEEHPAVVMGKATYSVWLDLTPEGRSRFYQWSRNHVNEHLLLILDRQVVANGRIALTMDVPNWEITNLKDGVAARKLVDFVNAQARSRR
jgi:hypothetical protein